MLGRMEQARAELRAIQARLQALDLDGVRAAEQDYLENSFILANHPALVLSPADTIPEAPGFDGLFPQDRG